MKARIHRGLPDRDLLNKADIVSNSKGVFMVNETKDLVPFEKFEGAFLIPSSIAILGDYPLDYWSAWHSPLRIRFSEEVGEPELLWQQSEKYETYYLFRMKLGKYNLYYNPTLNFSEDPLEVLQERLSHSVVILSRTPDVVDENAILLV